MHDDIFARVESAFMYFLKAKKPKRCAVKRTKQWCNSEGLSRKDGYEAAFKLCLALHGLDDVLLS